MATPKKKKAAPAKADPTKEAAKAGAAPAVKSKPKPSKKAAVTSAPKAPVIASPVAEGTSYASHEQVNFVNDQLKNNPTKCMKMAQVDNEADAREVLTNQLIYGKITREEF